jgi:addiction module HigA family antidote
MAKSKAPTPGAVLLSLMAEYQLNPYKLAKEIKLNPTSLRGILNGTMKVSVPAALRLAKYFGDTPQSWVDLQIRQDFAEAAKDSGLSALIKSIPKAKKPAAVKKTALSAAQKPSAAKSPVAAKKPPAAKSKSPAAAREAPKAKAAAAAGKPRKAKTPVAEPIGAANKKAVKAVRKPRQAKAPAAETIPREQSAPEPQPAGQTES